MERLVSVLDHQVSRRKTRIDFRVISKPMSELETSNVNDGPGEDQSMNFI